MLVNDSNSSTSSDNNLLLLSDHTSWGQRAMNALTACGFKVLSSSSLQETVSIVENQKPSFALLEMKYQDGNVYDLMPRIIKAHPSIQVTVCSAYISVKNALTLLRQGAHNTIAKPIPIELLLTSFNTEKLASTSSFNTKLAWRQAKGAYIEDMFSEYETVSATAKALGVDRRSLRRMRDNICST